MPTYKYKREDGTTFEIRQGINDDALEECPETGQKVKRVISGGGGVVYKGDGFYVTDYKNGGRKKNQSEASENTNNTSGSSENSSTNNGSAGDSSNS